MSNQSKLKVGDIDFFLLNPNLFSSEINKFFKDYILISKKEKKLIKGVQFLADCRLIYPESQCDDFGVFSYKYKLELCEIMDLIIGSSFVFLSDNCLILLFNFDKVTPKIMSKIVNFLSPYVKTNQI